MAERAAVDEAAARGVTVEEVWAERSAACQAGRVVSVDEVARVICFLASDEASGISGEAIKVAVGSYW